MLIVEVPALNVKLVGVEKLIIVGPESATAELFKEIDRTPVPEELSAALASAYPVTLVLNDPAVTTIVAVCVNALPSVQPPVAEFMVTAIELHVTLLVVMVLPVVEFLVVDLVRAIHGWSRMRRAISSWHRLAKSWVMPDL